MARRLVAHHIDPAQPVEPPRIATVAHHAPGGRSLHASTTHIGWDPGCMAHLAGWPQPELLDERELACMLMAVDWAPLDARPRLEALRRLRTPAKAGLDWLTGFDGMPSFRSLESQDDRLSWLVVHGLGGLLGLRDRWHLRRLGRALDAADARGIHACLVGLVRSAAYRGIKIGYAVPRLVLLRASARELSAAAELAFASRWLAEIALQYEEGARDGAQSAACYRAALSFAMESARAGDDPRDMANFIGLLMRSAAARGHRRDQLLPLLF